MSITVFKKIPAGFTAVVVGASVLKCLSMLTGDVCAADSPPVVHDMRISPASDLAPPDFPEYGYGDRKFPITIKVGGNVVYGEKPPDFLVTSPYKTPMSPLDSLMTYINPTGSDKYKQVMDYMGALAVLKHLTYDSTKDVYKFKFDDDLDEINFYLPMPLMDGPHYRVNFEQYISPNRDSISIPSEVLHRTFMERSIVMFMQDFWGEHPEFQQILDDLGPISLPDSISIAKPNPQELASMRAIPYYSSLTDDDILKAINASQAVVNDDVLMGNRERLSSALKEQSSGMSEGQRLLIFQKIMQYLPPDMNNPRMMDAVAVGRDGLGLTTYYFKDALTTRAMVTLGSGENICVDHSGKILSDVGVGEKALSNFESAGGQLILGKASLYGPNGELISSVMESRASRTIYSTAGRLRPHDAVEGGLHYGRLFREKGLVLDVSPQKQEILLSPKVFQIAFTRLDLSNDDPENSIKNLLMPRVKAGYSNDHNDFGVNLSGFRANLDERGMMGFANNGFIANLNYLGAWGADIGKNFKVGLSGAVDAAYSILTASSSGVYYSNPGETGKYKPRYTFQLDAAPPDTGSVGMSEDVVYPKFADAGGAFGVRMAYYNPSHPFTLFVESSLDAGYTAYRTSTTDPHLGEVRVKAGGSVLVRKVRFSFAPGAALAHEGNAFDFLGEVDAAGFSARGKYRYKSSIAPDLLPPMQEGDFDVVWKILKQERFNAALRVYGGARQVDEPREKQRIIRGGADVLVLFK
jgi:hypothetical protein